MKHQKIKAPKNKNLNVTIQTRNRTANKILPGSTGSKKTSIERQETEVNVLHESSNMSQQKNA